MVRSWIDKERSCLAPYATFASQSKGRVHPEEEHEFRSPFHRDRDRILHCAAFRRLKYKTQVFIFHEGDYYRTRLTHTLEVAQIARTIAVALGLNETLAESLALAHDLGHTPFGHAGEEILDHLMAPFGGFEHNLHALRIVDLLEVRYPDFPGLNLTWEVREGIVKHSSRYGEAVHLHEEFGASPPSLEAQVVEVADEIAYDSHDLDDALASGLISIDEVRELEIWKAVGEPEGIEKDSELYRHYGVRRIIDFLVKDVISSLQALIQETKIVSSADVRDRGERLVRFSPEADALKRELRDFLYRRVYNHYRVRQKAVKSQRIIEELFRIYRRHPELMPQHFFEKVDHYGLERVICDYIAGMTDRYAVNEYKKIFSPYEEA